MFRGIILMLTLVSVACAESVNTGPSILDANSKVIRLQAIRKREVPVITALSLQQSGDLLAAAGDDHHVRLWDVQTGELRQTLRGHRDWVTCMAFFDGGAKLLTGSRDRQVLVWHPGIRMEPIRLGRHARPISSLVVHEPTKQLAVLGFRAPLKIYSTNRAGEPLRVLPCPCTDTRAVAFSPSGERLAVGGRNGKLRIWNLSTDEVVNVVAHGRRLTSLVFASEHMLVSAGEDQYIHVWDARNGRKLNTLSHDSGKVLAMTSLADNRFAVATSKNEIPLFHLTAAEPYAVLRGHTGSVAALAARGNQLISGSFDTTVRIWSIDNSESQNQVSRPTPVTPTKPVGSLFKTSEQRSAE